MKEIIIKPEFKEERAILSYKDITISIPYTFIYYLIGILACGVDWGNTLMFNSWQKLSQGLKEITNRMHLSDSVINVKSEK